MKKHLMIIQKNRYLFVNNFIIEITGQNLLFGIKNTNEIINAVPDSRFAKAGVLLL